MFEPVLSIIIAFQIVIVTSCGSKEIEFIWKLYAYISNDRL